VEKEMKQKLSFELEKNPLLLPLKGTVRVGVLGSLEEMERVALLDPNAWGENMIWTVQIWDGRMVVPVQWSFWVMKSMTSGPLMANC
jgi:hypothetical protein